ncbi:MAG: hypothetical protein EPN23_03485 [Verrucomicrobia bacterium]|nr:MAG: hypothetical protein EPN23_03485 [Verrucomicrobiota bacterium]
MRLCSTGWNIVFGGVVLLAVWRAESAAAKPQAAETGPLLPALTNSPEANAFAVYTHENFKLVMDRQLRLTISPKDKGAYKGPVIQVSEPQFALFDTRGQDEDEPTITEFTELPPAKKQPDELNVEGKLSNNARFGVKYKFSGASIQISCWIRSAPAGGHATPIQFETEFASTHHFAPNIEIADRKKQMEGWYLKTSEKGIKDKSFKKCTYNYWDQLKFKREAQFLENFGPWGARKIVLRTSGSGEGFLHPYKRGGQSYAYAGFNCYFQVPTVPKKKSTATTLVITVE